MLYGFDVVVLGFGCVDFGIGIVEDEFGYVVWMMYC